MLTLSSKTSVVSKPSKEVFAIVRNLKGRSVKFITLNQAYITLFIHSHQPLVNYSPPLLPIKEIKEKFPPNRDK